jgi:hypothetical protein
MPVYDSFYRTFAVLSYDGISLKIVKTNILVNYIRALVNINSVDDYSSSFVLIASLGILSSFSSEVFI